MASRIIHLTISKKLEKYIPINNLNRFKLGQILPDAVTSKNKPNVNSHYRVKFENGQKTMDSLAFFNEFHNEILNDDLYLGYYFHLIQDIIFRKFLYYDLGLIKYRSSEGFVDTLYRDYHILNGYLVNKYELSNDLYVPINFKEEKINLIYSFDIYEFIEDMKNDFNDKINEEPTYFNKEAVEEYINKCVKICTEEFFAQQNGEIKFNPKDYVWENKS